MVRLVRSRPRAIRMETLSTETFWVDPTTLRPVVSSLSVAVEPSLVFSIDTDIVSVSSLSWSWFAPSLSPLSPWSALLSSSSPTIILGVSSSTESLSSPSLSEPPSASLSSPPVSPSSPLSSLLWESLLLSESSSSSSTFTGVVFSDGKPLPSPPPLRSIVYARPLV